MVVGKTLRSTTMLYGVVGATFLIVASADAADLFNKAPLAQIAPPPAAVDGVNGKVDGFGGSIANRSVFGAEGSLSVPLSAPYGLQIDGIVGSFDDRAFGNVAGHLFWRDPGRGLIGLYTSHTWWDKFGGAYVGHVAAEGEYYWNRWTLQGVAGIEFGNSVSSITTTTVVNPLGPITTTTLIQGFDVKTRFFDMIDVKYYFADNWNGYIGHRYLGGKHALALGTEAALPLQNGIMASAFVEGRVGENEFHGVWGGLRFYFGQKDKSLMARQRQDDPPSRGKDTMFSITNNFNQSVTPSTSPCPPGYILVGSVCELIPD